MVGTLVVKRLKAVDYFLKLKYVSFACYLASVNDSWVTLSLQWNQPLPVVRLHHSKHSCLKYVQNPISYSQFFIQSLSLDRTGVKRSSVVKCFTVIGPCFVGFCKC